MAWIEIRAQFDNAPDDWSPWIEVFRDNGCENTLQTDVPAELVGAIVDVEGAESVVEAIRGQLLDLGATKVEIQNLPETNWEENWKQFFKPRRVGNHFMVRPTWETTELAEGDLEIVLDPGQAFGTGDHPTTRLCMELMELANIKGKLVADVGCGSGILSVAAVKLGATYVAAVDIEPLSVEVSKENAKMNGVKFDCLVGDGLSSLEILRRGRGDHPWDVVISNIISATLMRLAPDIAASLAEGGLWIASGIIESNWPLVVHSAERSGFKVVDVRKEDGWIAGLLQKGGI